MVKDAMELQLRTYVYIKVGNNIETYRKETQSISIFVFFGNYYIQLNLEIFN